MIPITYKERSCESSTTHLGLHAMSPTSFPDFNPRFDSFRSVFMKPQQQLLRIFVYLELPCYRRTNITELLVAFPDHAISPANNSRTPCICNLLLLGHRYYCQMGTSRNQLVALILRAIRNVKQESSRVLNLYPANVENMANS